MPHQRNLGSIPTREHYVILTQRHLSIAGDQRSIDHPGHGYGALDEYIIEYDAYTNEGEWKAKITELVATKVKFKAFYVEPAVVKTHLEVSRAKLPPSLSK